MVNSINHKLAIYGFPIVIFSILLTSCATSETEPVAPVSSKVATTPKTQVTSLPVEDGIVGVTTGMDCSTLISIEDLYKYNPSYSLDPSFSPQPGSLAKLATDYKGISCTFINLSSGDSFTISLAKFAPESFNVFKQKRVEGSTQVSSESIPSSFIGLFVSGTNGGTLEILGNDYWLSATAPWAQTPEDLLKPLSSALTKLN